MPGHETDGKRKTKYDSLNVRVILSEEINGTMYMYLVNDEGIIKCIGGMKFLASK